MGGGAFSTPALVLRAKEKLALTLPFFNPLEAKQCSILLLFRFASTQLSPWPPPFARRA
jgi:hypothetical protein